MKVVITRKDFDCAFEGCASGKIVKVGTIAITVKIPSKTGGRIKFTLHYHPDCYEQSNKDYIRKKIKEQEEILIRRRKKSGKPQGRPRKYTDMLLARNIKAKIFNHKKLGHTERVLLLEKQLKELEVGNAVIDNTQLNPGSISVPIVYKGITVADDIGRDSIILSKSIDPMEKYNPNSPLYEGKKEG